MLKRTKGRFLLTLLVITGLAGTLKDSSLTKQERKVVLNELKETKSDLLKSVKGLSEAQLNYKASPDRWSVKECVFHITLSEKNLWQMLDAAMKEPAAPEKRTQVRFTDEALIKAIEDRSTKVKTSPTLEPVAASWSSANDALSAFKEARTDHIKYAKLTTQDMRDHFVDLPFGKLDAYQFMLFMAAHSNRHTQQINEVKADPGFPKQ